MFRNRLRDRGWTLAGLFCFFVLHVSSQSHRPQTSVLTGLGRNAIGTTIRLSAAAWYDPAMSAHARGVVATFPALVDAVVAMDQANEGDANLTAGIGLSPSLWARWRSSLSTPVGMVDFPGYEGVGGWPRMPRIEGDLFVHAKAGRRDALYTLVSLLVRHLGAAAISDVLTVDAWTNALDGQNRDLTGFVDGTVNAPSGQKALAGLISAAVDPAHVNGSFAIAQVWHHDLAAFGALNLTAQEAVFGRTKAQSLPLAHQAPSSHVARVRQSALGYFIVRQAMPWGDPASAGVGLLFIAYSGDAHHLDTMCRSMVGSGPGIAGAPHGVPDAIMRFSSPTTGNYWYFPSIEMLAQLAKQPVAVA
nr:dyp-type peroxidase [Pandoravirus massiliensis]